ISAMAVALARPLREQAPWPQTKMGYFSLPPKSAGRKIVPSLIPGSELVSTTTSCGPVPPARVPVAIDGVQLPDAGSPGAGSLVSAVGSGSAGAGSSAVFSAGRVMSAGSLASVSRAGPVSSSGGALGAVASPLEASPSGMVASLVSSDGDDPPD